MQVGIGLWSMRSTVYSPAPWPQLYARLREDAALAEELGFDTLWLAEHHFWYDGWCPQPLVAAAAALSATSTLRIGTAMHLLPLHDVDVVSRDLVTIGELYGDRFDLGVGLGYRDEEYDGFGLRRDQRGALMSAHLDALLTAHSGRWHSPPPVYVGGLADAAVRRAGRRGLGLLLPNSLSLQEISLRRETAHQESTAAGLAPGRIGMLVDVWITSGSQRENDRVLDRLVTSYREYAGAWFQLQGEQGFSRPDLLDKQSARTRAAAIVGSPDVVVERLLALRAAGVETFALQIRADLTAPVYRKAMRDLSRHVLPALRDAA